MEVTKRTDHNGDINKKPKKWEGIARAHLKSLEPSQVWPLLEDFFGLDKWFPTLAVCLPLEGKSGQVGCVRFCAGFKTPVDEKAKTPLPRAVNWTKQKLLSIDPREMVFSYSITDGNVGFRGYVATWRVVGPAEEEGHLTSGCIIEWRYEVEPVEGWELRDLDGFIGDGLSEMADRIELAFRSYFEVTV